MGGQDQWLGVGTMQREGRDGNFHPRGFRPDPPRMGCFFLNRGTGWGAAGILYEEGREAWVWFYLALPCPATPHPLII